MQTYMYRIQRNPLDLNLSKVIVSSNFLKLRFDDDNMMCHFA